MTIWINLYADRFHPTLLGIKKPAVQLSKFIENTDVRCCTLTQRQELYLVDEMTVTRTAIKFLTYAYALVVIAVVCFVTNITYEFMVGEIDNGKRLTICDLPKSDDDTTDVYAPATLILVLVLFLPGSVKFLRTRRVNTQLALGLIALLVWTYRFFLRQAGC